MTIYGKLNQQKTKIGEVKGDDVTRDNIPEYTRRDYDYTDPADVMVEGSRNYEQNIELDDGKKT